MDAFSLLCCKSATKRHDELKIWLYVALAAMVFVIFDRGAEQIILELAFAAALCLRQGAALAARAIRKSVNVITAIGVMARAEGRQVQRQIAGIDHVTTGYCSPQFIGKPAGLLRIARAIPPLPGFTPAAPADLDRPAISLARRTVQPRELPADRPG
jgi:hypothetical protein